MAFVSAEQGSKCQDLRSPGSLVRPCCVGVGGFRGHSRDSGPICLCYQDFMEMASDGRASAGFQGGRDVFIHRKPGASRAQRQALRPWVWIAGNADISAVRQLSSLGACCFGGNGKGAILSPGTSKESSLGLQLGCAMNGCHLHYCKSHMNGVPGS